MPLPLIALGAAAVPQVLKLAQGFSQLHKANKVKVESTVTPAFNENLALLRQGANARMPGYGMAENQLAQGQSNMLALAQRAGGSSADILSAISAQDVQRQQGMEKLNVQNQGYQANGRRALSAGLLQLSDIQRQDMLKAAQARAALKQSGNTNVFGAVEGLANTAAYFGSKPAQGQAEGMNNNSFNLFGPASQGGYDSDPRRVLLRSYS